MEQKCLHIYTDTKLMQSIIAKELDDKNHTRNEQGHLVIYGKINMDHESFKVDVVATETFRQFTMHEIERKSPDSIMVFLSKEEDKEECGEDTEALVMYRGMKEVITYDSLKKLWTNIANIVQLKVAVMESVPVENKDEKNVYKMTSNPMGFCMIINNRDFEARREEDVERVLRKGTDVDAKNLFNLFGSLGFNVVRHDNLTDSHIIREIKKMSLEDHTDYDAFICCILSHGKHGSILGVNNKEVPIAEITSHFRIRGCPTLAEKPKLFFIQACQGQRPQRGVESFIERDVFPDEDSKCVLPDGSDFLVACSSEPGFESFRHTDKGSFFINSLVKHVQASGDTGNSLLHILTDVCNDMCQETFDSGFKQVPWLTSTLTKRFVFKQKTTSHSHC